MHLIVKQIVMQNKEIGQIGGGVFKRNQQLREIEATLYSS